MTDITIPPAALEAWEGMQQRIHIEQAIILPLTEKPDDKA